MRQLLLSLAALLLAMPSAYATPLLQGGVVSGSGTNFPLLNTSYAATPISGFISNAGLTVGYTEYVDYDADNVFCAGCLDFLIKITNSSLLTSGENVEHVTAGSFAGFLTDVGIFVGAQPGVNPTSIDRTSGPGDTVTFDFAGDGNITPGESANLLVIETNATSFGAGSFSAQDDVSVNVAGFAPAPEPMSVTLLGGGLALLGWIGLRRRAKN